MNVRGDEITISTAELTSATSGHRLRVTGVGGASGLGRRRRRNEDAWGYRGTRAFAVADGMGGLVDGELAAAEAVAALVDSLHDGDDDWSRLVHAVNERVRRASLGDPDASGAVAVGLRCRSDRVTLLQVGDARVYRIREGTVQQLTRDHSVAEAIADLGVRRSRSGLADRQLGSVTSYFGGPGSCDEFSVHELTVRHGDRLVLTTDGVHDVADLQTWNRVACVAKAADAADLLVDAALALGAGDDRTALVVDFELSLRSARRVADDMGT